MFRIADGAAAALHRGPDRPTRRRHPPMSGTASLGDGPDAPGSAAAGDRPSAASDPDVFEAFHLAAASPNHGSVRRSYGPSPQKAVATGGQGRPRDNPVDQISLDRRRPRLIPVDVRSAPKGSPMHGKLQHA